MIVSLQWNPSCEATPFVQEMWPLKGDGLTSGVVINTFMFRLTFLGRFFIEGFGLLSGWPLKRGPNEIANLRSPWTYFVVYLEYLREGSWVTDISSAIYWRRWSMLLHVNRNWSLKSGARSTKILTHDSALRMRSCNTLTLELRVRSAIPFVRIFVEWPPGTQIGHSPGNAGRSGKSQEKKFLMKKSGKFLKTNVKV